MKPAAAIALAALALCACRAEQANEADTSEAPGAPGGGEETAAPGWDGFGEGADYALTFWDEAGAPMVSMRCVGEPRMFEVEMHTVAPIASEERLGFGLGDEAITMVADVAHSSGHVVASIAYGADIAEALRAAPDVSASYGADSYGPVSPPSAEDAEALIASCEG